MKEKTNNSKWTVEDIKDQVSPRKEINKKIEDFNITIKSVHLEHSSGQNVSPKTLWTIWDSQLQIFWFFNIKQYIWDRLWNIYIIIMLSIPLFALQNAIQLVSKISISINISI
jgi:hypothetical protein